MPLVFLGQILLFSLGINSEQVQHPVSAVIIGLISSNNLEMMRGRMYIGFLLVPKLVALNGIMAICN